MKKIILLVVLTIGISVNNISADEINTGKFNNTAIGGYDPVAYHLLEEPKKGNSGFTTTWKGADWHFISKENLDIFISDPEFYAPQYGGFCANGLSDEHKIKGKPKNWRIHNNKLYLFYSKKGKAEWDFEIDQQIQLASDYWEQVRFN